MREVMLFLVRSGHVLLTLSITAETQTCYFCTQSPRGSCSEKMIPKEESVTRISRACLVCFKTAIVSVLQIFLINIFIHVYIQI